MIDAALALHAHIMRSHWHDGELVGPDHGIRVNYRAGRFVKSYLPWLPWHDQMYYLQGQAYWVLANWRLHDVTGEARFAEIATLCSQRMLERQRPDGAWDYPNREWKGRIATAEGAWASIGLLESYRRTGQPGLLEGALDWNRYVDEQVGYQPVAGGSAVNYFAGRPGSAVPNNSAFTLRLLADLHNATGDAAYLERCPELVRFLLAVQASSGELPYEVRPDGRPIRQHFQCYQYNAFQCLDLIRYREATGDAEVAPLIAGLLRFLRTGVDGDGHVFYDCSSGPRRVTYHAAVVAATFAAARRRGGASDELANRCVAWICAQQRPDGSMPHSQGDYRVLSDRRSYPRNLSMIVFHLAECHTDLVSAQPENRRPSPAEAG